MDKSKKPPWDGRVRTISALAPATPEQPRPGIVNPSPLSPTSTVRLSAASLPAAESTCRNQVHMPQPHNMAIDEQQGPRVTRQSGDWFGASASYLATLQRDAVSSPPAPSGAASVNRVGRASYDGLSQAGVSGIFTIPPIDLPSDVPGAAERLRTSVAGQFFPPASHRPITPAPATGTIPRASNASERGEDHPPPAMASGQASTQMEEWALEEASAESAAQDGETWKEMLQLSQFAGLVLRFPREVGTPMSNKQLTEQLWLHRTTITQIYRLLKRSVVAILSLRQANTTHGAQVAAATRNVRAVREAVTCAFDKQARQRALSASVRRLDDDLQREMDRLIAEVGDGLLPLPPKDFIKSGSSGSGNGSGSRRRHSSGSGGYGAHSTIPWPSLQGSTKSGTFHGASSDLSSASSPMLHSSTTHCEQGGLAASTLDASDSSSTPTGGGAQRISTQRRVSFASNVTQAGVVFDSPLSAAPHAEHSCDGSERTVASVPSLHPYSPHTPSAPHNGTPHGLTTSSRLAREASAPVAPSTPPRPCKSEPAADGEQPLPQAFVLEQRSRPSTLLLGSVSAGLPVDPRLRQTLVQLHVRSAETGAVREELRAAVMAAAAAVPGVQEEVLQGILDHLERQRHEYEAARARRAAAEGRLPPGRRADGSPLPSGVAGALPKRDITMQLCQLQSDVEWLMSRPIKASFTELAHHIDSNDKRVEELGAQVRRLSATVAATEARAALAEAAKAEAEAAAAAQVAASAAVVQQLAKRLGVLEAAASGWPNAAANPLFDHASLENSKNNSKTGEASPPQTNSAGLPISQPLPFQTITGAAVAAAAAAPHLPLLMSRSSGGGAMLSPVSLAAIHSRPTSLLHRTASAARTEDEPVGLAGFPSAQPAILPMGGQGPDSDGEQDEQESGHTAGWSAVGPGAPEGRSAGTARTPLGKDSVPAVLPQQAQSAPTGLSKGGLQQ